MYLFQHSKVKNEMKIEKDTEKKIQQDKVFEKHNNRSAGSALLYEIYHNFKVSVDGPYGFHILYIPQKSAAMIASEAG